MLLAPSLLSCYLHLDCMRPLALRNVLVASDLSAASLPALRGASELATLASARMHIVHVGDKPSAEQALAEHIVSARLSAPLAEARCVQGPPGAAIAQEAWRTQADVIILGPHRRERPVVLGNTADRVVRVTEAPCLILQQPLALPLGSVLAAVDVAEGARGILAVAMTWASALRRRGTSGSGSTVLLAFHVIPTESGNSEAEAALQREVEQIRRHLASIAGVEVQQSFDHGDDPASAILRRAEGGSYDLVVLGTRGKRDPHGAPLGSVSSAVVSRATMPVLLVPPALWKSTERDPLP